jgi:hypothetical protein
MFFERNLFKQLWILLTSNYFIIVFAWSGEVILKNLGEKEYFRIKGTNIIITRKILIF